MRLLCADDEDDIRTILALALSLDPGIEAEFVASGDAVMARAHEGWDAFLLDGMMPGLDGYETCRQLKANPRTAHIPVIFLTARTTRDEVTEALALGATGALAKPFDPLTLANELRRLIGA